MTDVLAPSSPVDTPGPGGWRDRAVGYALAITLVAVAHGASVFAWRPQSPAPYTLFLAAVLLSALYGGYGPSLLATALACLDLVYSFVAPYHSIFVNVNNELIFVLTFSAVAVLTSSLQARRRSAEASLRKAHDELERRVRDRTAELATSREQLAALVNDLLTIAEREQQRIGHDLHDGLGQELTGISMLCVALADELHHAGSPAAGHADEVARLVQQSMGHTRDLARGLGPVDLETDGLAAVLSRLADRVSRLPGVRCAFDADGDTPPDAAANIHLFRIAQEAINNALRHGEAKHIDVLLSVDNARTSLVLTDDGSGFSPNCPAGMGLRLMRYRARIIGAKLTITPGPAGGTRITCEIPS